jgi:hypothetical protein
MDRTLTLFASDADLQGRLLAFASALARDEGSSPHGMGNARPGITPTRRVPIVAIGGDLYEPTRRRSATRTLVREHQPKR